MAGNMRINWKRLILALVVSLGAGVISWLLTGNSMEMYANIKKPPLSPPGQVFPIVWTFWLAFFWLMLLWVLIIFTVWRFFHVNKVAAWMMVPYLLWVTFAAYLNLAVAIINVK